MEVDCLSRQPACPPTIVLPAATPAFSGAKGLRPLLVTTVGFNTSTAAHAWWEQSGPNAVNENFFTSVRHLRVVIGAGNPGAVTSPGNEYVIEVPRAIYPCFWVHF